MFSDVLWNPQYTRYLPIPGAMVRLRSSRGAWRRWLVCLLPLSYALVPAMPGSKSEILKKLTPVSWLQWTQRQLPCFFWGREILGEGKGLKHWGSWVEWSGWVRFGKCQVHDQANKRPFTSKMVRDSPFTPFSFVKGGNFTSVHSRLLLGSWGNRCRYGVPLPTTLGLRHTRWVWKNGLIYGSDGLIQGHAPVIINHNHRHQQEGWLDFNLGISTEIHDRIQCILDHLNVPQVLLVKGWRN